MKQLKMTSKPSPKLIALLMLPLTITNSFAENTLSNTQTIKCSSIIKACDKALADKDAAIKARDAQLGDYARLTKSQADEIAADKAWYNSKWLWLAIGAGTTAYLLRK
jgi:hypothetical protein